MSNKTKHGIILGRRIKEEKMIRVIRQDGIEILLNTDLIETIEEGENKTSLIKLTTGDIIHAKSPAWDISQKAKAYIRGIMQEEREFERGKDKDKSPKDKEVDNQKDKEKEKPREKPNFEKRDRPQDKDKPRDRDREKKGKDFSKNRK